MKARGWIPVVVLLLAFGGGLVWAWRFAEIDDPGELVDDAGGSSRWNLVLEVEGSVRDGSPDDQEMEKILQTVRRRLREHGAHGVLMERIGEVVSKRGIVTFSIVRSEGEFGRSLTRIDRAIVEVLGPASLDLPPLREDTCRGPGRGPAGPGLERLLGLDKATETVGGSAAREGTGPGPLSSLLSAFGPGVFVVREQHVPLAREYLSLNIVREAISHGTELHWSAFPLCEGGDSYREIYVLEAEPIVAGEHVADAWARREGSSHPEIFLEMTGPGARLLERATRQHVNDRLALVLDGLVLSAPVIRQPLSRRV